MPELIESASGRGLQGGDPAGEPVEAADLPADAVQDDEARPCGRELEAENAALSARVAELESALAGVEQRFALERALVDAGVIDLETALAVAGPRAAAGEAPGSIVSEMVGSKPFLFRAPPARAAGSSLGGASVPAEASLTGLADEARRMGDRGSLTRYLRKRRGG